MLYTYLSAISIGTFYIDFHINSNYSFSPHKLTKFHFYFYTLFLLILLFPFALYLLFICDLFNIIYCSDHYPSTNNEQFHSLDAKEETLNQQSNSNDQTIKTVSSTRNIINNNLRENIDIENQNRLNVNNNTTIKVNVQSNVNKQLDDSFKFKNKQQNINIQNLSDKQVFASGNNDSQSSPGVVSEGLCSSVSQVFL